MSVHGLGVTAAAAVQRQHADVALTQARVAEALADDVGVAVDEQLGDAVPGRDAQPLAHVDLGEGDLVVDVVEQPLVNSGDALVHIADVSAGGE